MIELKELSDWEKLKEESRASGKPIFLAKLSPICPVSHAAEKVVLDWVGQEQDQTFLAARIDVIRARDLSRGIAKEIDVVHQSPQAIRLSPEGEPVWDADHFDITTEALTQAFS
jgi:bacillithiol system protein YtxJ